MIGAGQKNAQIIAIDGPAASGKGTLARHLAGALSFAHMDTGALYRAVAYEILQEKTNLDHPAYVLQACRRLKDRLAGSGDVLSNPDLRNDDVGQVASKIAAIPAVREALIDLQRDFAFDPPKGAKGAVLDGRDIGTVICPDAPLKLFVTADIEIRAKRRLKELQSKGLEVTYGAVLEDMRARDARDARREAAPLKPSEDAVLVNSSHLTEGEMLEMALGYAKKAFSVFPSSEH